MMRDLKGHLFAILSGVAMLIVGVSLLFSVLGLRAGIANFSTVVTGLITSAGSSATASSRLVSIGLCGRCR
ncbi:MAG: hypothetical protein O3C12_07240, partial [Proteobacteria bacterium]|nr:hypothetical protein [Pseudomonadota bacterium]